MSAMSSRPSRKSAAMSPSCSSCSTVAGSRSARSARSVVAAYSGVLVMVSSGGMSDERGESGCRAVAGTGWLGAARLRVLLLGLLLGALLAHRLLTLRGGGACLLGLFVQTLLLGEVLLHR